MTALTRRGFCLLALTCATPLPASAQAASLRDRIDSHVRRQMQLLGTPGLALALVDRRGVRDVRTHGFADVDRRAPVTSQTRFQIGSITKSFTAIIALQLVEDGRLDLHRPVNAYLPWFTPQSRFRPITAHDLLSHTSGLPNDRLDIPSGPAQAYFAREREVVSAPGAVYAYSNLGYQVLTSLLESIERKPYREIAREHILNPLGLRDAQPAIINDQRPAMAKGYERIHDDRPSRPDDPLVEAPWIEYGSGDGSVALTIEELGAYLAMLLNHGRSGGTEVLPPERFEQMVTPYAPAADGAARYGYGVLVSEDQGTIHHDGAMPGFRAFLIGDLSSGRGAVVLTNGPGRSGAIARHALQSWNAAEQGEALPEADLPASPLDVQAPERFAGRYLSPSGDSLRFEAQGDRLLLVDDTGRFALLPYGENRFLGPRPAFALFPIVFAGDERGINEVWSGEKWFAAETYRGPRRFPTPDAWQAYCGHYRIMQPWSPTNFRILVRKGRLWFVWPEGDEAPLTPIGEHRFRIGEQPSGEQVHFGDIVDGTALTSTYSAMRFYRFFTP